MAYYSLHAYDADVWIPSFVGLNEYGAGDNVDVRYAVEVQNVETPGGVLQPAALEESYSSPGLGYVETLLTFRRRWAVDENEKEVLIIASGGKIYYTITTMAECIQIDLPNDVVAFSNNCWSAVSYEIPAENDAGKVDVLLVTNPDDGMYMIIPPDALYTWNSAKTQTWQYFKGSEEPYGTWEDMRTAKWTMDPVDTRTDPDDDDEPQKKFAFIERYAERIWGGGCKDQPDTMYYSRAYDPTDWSGPEEGDDPADAAGEIQQPSWDGDKFTALKRFGDTLIAFKEHHIWRITGSDPSNYVFSEQFGGGCPYPGTIVEDVERLLFAQDDGLAFYDGSSVQPFMRQYIDKTWKDIQNGWKNKPTGLMFDERYYLKAGNFTIIYNKVDNSFLLNTSKAECICVYKGKVVGHDYMIGRWPNPGRNNGLTLLYDSWKTGKVTSTMSRWFSPWMDFGYKRITKGGFDLYFTPEVKNKAVTFTFRVRTEKKVKEKTYTVNPMTAQEKENGKLLKPKKLHFSGTGRRFRVEIEVNNETDAPWRLLGGLHLVVETDSD